MIVIYHDQRQRFEAITSFLEHDLPKQERWRWDRERKRWYTEQEDIARRLAKYAQGTAALRLNQLSPAEQQALADSQAHDAPANFIIPAPPGEAYLPYQRAAIFYSMGRRGTLNGDDMGLGKTVEAIGVVNMLSILREGGYAPSSWENGHSRQQGHHADPNGHSEPQARPLPPIERVLIVCPASLRLNWQAEWRKWHTGKLRPVLLDAWPNMASLFQLKSFTEGKALIVSYDSVKKWHPMIAAEPWDVLICDEAHMLKDESTRRAKSLFGGTYKRKDVFKPILARRKLFLTGTSIVNSAADLWPLVKALAPNGLGSSRVDFMERYGSNGQLDELHTRLRTQIMVRRRKDDVLKELPPKRRQIVLLDVAGADSIVAAETEALSFAKAQLERARAEIASLPHGEQVTRLRQCRSIAMTEIARVRKETAMKKLPAAIEHIHDILGNIDKAVIFAHHHDVLDGLWAAFPRIAVRLDGRTDQRERKAVVDDFQTNRGTRLFLCGIKAAGLGLTLTAASVVVFCEMDWTPMVQAEDRLHRIGQHSPVLVQHLVIDGSIDSKMAKIIIGKQAIMDAALDGGSKEERDRDILEELMA